MAQKSKFKSSAVKFEGEGFVIWEDPKGYNNWGFKSIGVKMSPPPGLKVKFKGDDLELVKSKWLEPKEQNPDYPDDTPVVYMSIIGDGGKFKTKGYEQEIEHKNVYLEYSIMIKDGKGKHEGRRFANLVVKKIEVLQEEEEAA